MTLNKEFEWCKDYGIDKVIVDVTNHDKFITIYNSSKILKTKHIKEVIDWLYEHDIAKKIFKYGKFVAIAEWKAHTMLYNMGIETIRTEHVDYNIDIPFYEVSLYVIISLFYNMNNYV